MKRWMAAAAAAFCLTALAPGLAMTARADWVEEDGKAHFLDGSGNYVRSDWRTRDGERYYLDSEGNVAENTWVQNIYYVGDDGAMLKNAWVEEDGESGLKDAGWYYVGQDGKLETNKWKTIGGFRYSFDSDGRMRTGWHYEDGDIYYLGDGDEGFARTGWQFLEYSERKRPAEGEISRKLEEGDGRGRWFYFQVNGKAKKSPAGSYEMETINDKRYYFDANGMMCTGWLAVRDQAAPEDATGISRFVYLGGREEGLLRRQWLELAEHPWDSEFRSALTVKDADYDGPEEGESVRYYFTNDGTPAFLPKGAASLKQASVDIEGESYLFDPYGCLQTGLVQVGGQTGYFGPEGGNGIQRIGRVEDMEDRLGRSFTGYFSTTGSDKGVGFTGEKDGFLYWKGLMVSAKEGTDVQPFLVDGKVYLVNESGRVQTNEKAYASDGTYAYRIADGILYETDEEGEKTEAVKAGRTLPAAAYAYTYTPKGAA